MPGPCADEWEKLAAGHDDLRGIERPVPALEAEVRRLRSELLRVQDELGNALEERSWPGLLAAATRVRAMAEAALVYRPGLQRRP